MMEHTTFNPFQFKIRRMDSYNDHEFDEKGDKRSSTWALAPYFLIYFIVYIVNFLVWPLLVMERLCADAYNEKNVSLFSNVSLNQSTPSCIGKYIINSNSSNSHNQKLNDEINNRILNLMIIGTVTSAMLSLISYFVIWKPTLNNCKPLATFLPPLCILCQCVLYAYSLTLKDTTAFKYVVMAGLILPSLHCNFQGVFLLFFRLTNTDEKYSFKQKRDIVNTKIDLTHTLVFVAIIFGGFAIGVCFDFSYSLIFVIQFTLAFVGALYAVILAPISCSCFATKDTNVDKDDISRNESCDGNTSEEEEAKLLMKNAKSSKDRGLLSKEGNLFSEAPMIFSETSYRKELIVIMELSIFTVAIIADANVSGTYLLQEPFQLSLREYGYCIAAQGVGKTIGLLFMKIILYFKPMKHSTVVLLAALNYLLYYTVLAVIPSKDYVYIALVINFFGGIAVPALISFMKINFTETIEAVLEISVISSLIVTVGFSSIEYVVYMKTRTIFPGTIFLMTSGLILLGFVIVMATFCSTSVKNKRRTKDYADQLLNDYQ